MSVTTAHSGKNCHDYCVDCLSRKFVILDPETDPYKIAAPALATFSLGGVRERDDRLEAMTTFNSSRKQ